MKTFFKNMKIKIEMAIMEDIKKIIEEIGDDQIYAVALVTDSDCITLYMAVNTNEYMNKADEEYIEMFQEDLKQEEIAKCKKRLISFTQWIPDEWGYSDGNNSELNKISKILYEKEKEIENYTSYAGLFFETITSALKDTIEARCFGENSKEMTYFISISDDEKTTQIEKYSAKLLNTKSIYEKFINRPEV